jgi:beta-N-acetylhexosaminidase
MLRLRVVSLACLSALAASASLSCVPPAPAAATPRDSGVAAVSRVGAPLDTARWIADVLASLTPRQRVAQMTMFWMLGDYTSRDDTTFAEIVSWVEREGAGGITMSLGTPIEVAEKLNYLQRRSRVPLIVASDLEPSLMRLEAAVFPHYLLETGGATSFPTQMAIAATARDSDAFDVARAIAEEARASGIHVNFAPVVDVNINPNNPVIGTRSFGEDPARVSRLSALFVDGTRAGGALATAKHFPGHGDTDVDSHVGLPVVKADMPRLRSVELRPFEAAIGAGADLVMSAHIALPALGGDSATPATLRRDVMHDLLRDSLGFRGVAITDALSMAGVGRGYSVEETVVGAIKAGADILLRPAAGDARPNEIVRAIDAVVAAVQRNELSQARIDSSVVRILLMKARAGLARSREVSLDTLRLVVGSAPHRALAQDVAQRSITLVRDSAATVPIGPTAKIAVVTYMPETELKASRAFTKELRTLRPNARVVAKLSPTTAPVQLDSIGRALAGSDAVIIAMFVRRVEGEGRTTVPPPIAAWMDSVAATTPSAVVIAFGNPYLLRQLPHARAYINTYTVGDPSEIAAARAVVGARPIRGRSPVSLPGFFKAGDGLDR